MGKEERWYWWAGFHGDVEHEGLYTLGEFNTRDEAIAAGRAELPDLDGYEFFHIVEAQFADTIAGSDDDPDDFQPFGAARNAEIISA